MKCLEKLWIQAYLECSDLHAIREFAEFELQNNEIVEDEIYLLLRPTNSIAFGCLQGIVEARRIDMCGVVGKCAATLFLKDCARQVLSGQMSHKAFGQFVAGIAANYLECPAVLDSEDFDFVWLGEVTFLSDVMEETAEQRKVTIRSLEAFVSDPLKPEIMSMLTKYGD